MRKVLRGREIMMQKIQRFGAAMFTPVLLFSFSGIMVALAILFRNQDIIGSVAAPGTMWNDIWYVVEQGAWTVFNQLPLLFAIGLPIGLAKKNNARACLESFVLYITFNYFVAAMLKIWGTSFGVDYSLEAGGGTGLAMIASIKTLDLGMVGAILVSAIVVYLHDKFFDKDLPDFLGVFKGSSLVCIVGFFVMIPLALIACILWPKVQLAIASMQGFLKVSGGLGIWIYTFLERILIPTGLHHFIYTPFIFGPAVVNDGIAAYWPAHIKDFSTSAYTLKQMFPEGGFALHGMSKVFGCTGMALAMYATAKPEKKKVVAGLLIPATLTAIFAGVTEPVEFTFLFVAPMLFVVHAVLAATMSATAYAFGVTGNFGGGVIDWAVQNWLPLFKYHPTTYIIQIVVGLAFVGIYFLIFRFLILKFDFKTIGRKEGINEEKLYRKADYKAKKESDGSNQLDEREIKAKRFLEALGGKENIEDVTNCATRLRITVKDPSLVKDSETFVKAGAHGLVNKGKAVQVIVGLSVPQVRERFECLL